MLVDSHCHLFFNGLKDNIPDVIKRAKAEGVDTIICVGIDLESSRECIRLAEKYPEVFASVGVHPHDAQKAPEDYLQQLEILLKHPRVVAVGEIGLDYYRQYSPHDIQRQVFREQLELARTAHKPYIFHNRSADEDIIRCLKEVGYYRGVAHCFSSDLPTARQFVEWGLMVSFAGNITYKKSSLPKVARGLPLSHLMVETDSPFLSPVPFRGKPNKPERVRLVAEKLATVHCLTFKEIVQTTAANTRQLFEL
jgi:TatD DNase family protein